MITPAEIGEYWPDWYHLAPAFVFAYGPEELEEMQDAAVCLIAIAEHDDVRLTGVDRAHLRASEVTLDMYPEMRTTEE